MVGFKRVRVHTTWRSMRMVQTSYIVRRAMYNINTSAAIRFNAPTHYHRVQQVIMQSAAGLYNETPTACAELLA